MKVDVSNLECLSTVSRLSFTDISHANHHSHCIFDVAEVLLGKLIRCLPLVSAVQNPQAPTVV